MRVAALVLLAGALTTPAVSAHVRPNNPWTPKQGETMRVIRGTKLYVLHCRGLGSRRATYRHFACSGQTSRDEKSPHTALFKYILHTLGKYVGPRSGYIATNVRVTAFNVP
jgi:hypothetical protein